MVNNMEDNGTSIHWHGIRQLGSCQMDGANGVTECPIPPGKSFTYKMQATQYGKIEPSACTFKYGHMLMH